MSRKRGIKKRRKGKGSGGGAPETRLIPPWLFYGVAAGFGILCVVLLAWAHLNPPTN